MGARFGELAGHEIVDEYGSVEAEYLKLTQSAAAIDFSFRGRICALGNDRTKFVHGQVTNDIARLNVGEGCYAALVSAKGKLQSDLFVFALKDELLLDFEPGLTSTIIERLERYIIADDVQLVDVSEHYSLITLQGPDAASLLSRTSIFGEIPARPLTWTSRALEEGEIYAMNNPRLATTGFDLYIPSAATQRIAKLFPDWCGFKAFEMARIEAGIPRHGADMDESNLAPEAIQERAISYSKGCYIGQEVIARIRTYGKVAKALRLIRLPDELQTLPAPGVKLFRDGKDVGYICSSTLSPKHGAKVALGYVRKECNSPGEMLNLGAPDGGAACVLAGSSAGSSTAAGHHPAK